MTTGCAQRLGCVSERHQTQAGARTPTADLVQSSRWRYTILFLYYFFDTFISLLQSKLDCVIFFFSFSPRQHHFSLRLSARIAVSQLETDLRRKLLLLHRMVPAPPAQLTQLHIARRFVATALIKLKTECRVYLFPRDQCTVAVFP